MTDVADRTLAWGAAEVDSATMQLWHRQDRPQCPNASRFRVGLRGYQCPLCQWWLYLEPEPPMFPHAPAWVDQSSPTTITARFWNFHCKHPDVLHALARLTRELTDRGHRHLGIAMLWETLRYKTMLGAAPGEEPFKLNNDYRAYYARLLMERLPELDGIFTVRRLGRYLGGDKQ